jgi:hypothetical protein
MDQTTDVAARKLAFDSLLSVKDAELPALLRQLLSDADLRGSALRGLGTYDDAQTPNAILPLYSSLSAAHKRDARNTLAGRPAYAQRLLTAVEANQISKSDLTADLIQQLRNLKNPEVDALLAKVWGTARESSADMKTEIARVRNIFHAGGSQPGDAHARAHCVHENLSAVSHHVWHAAVRWARISPARIAATWITFSKTWWTRTR